MPAEVRAIHLQTLVAALPALGRERASAIAGALPAARLRRIEEAGRLEWLPASLLVELCEAARAAVGDEALERWGTAALQAVLRAPLARAFYEAALALHRRDPAVMLSYLVKAWPLLYSGCGDLVVAHAERMRVRLTLAPVPEPLRNAATVLPLVGAFAAIPTLCGFEGAARADWGPASPRLVCHVTWR